MQLFAASSVRYLSGKGDVEAMTVESSVLTRRVQKQIDRAASAPVAKLKKDMPCASMRPEDLLRGIAFCF